MSNEITITGRLIWWKSCEDGSRPGLSLVRCGVQDLLSGEIIDNLPAAGLDYHHAKDKVIEVTVRVVDRQAAELENAES